MNQFAVQEPDLTFSVPASQKIAGGYDALNRMVEEYFSGPIGDNLATGFKQLTTEGVAVILRESM